MQRRFTADGPDRLWSTDVAQHCAADGWVYCCAVIDAWSRRVVGWSIADHIRTELVVDACRWPAGNADPPRARSLSLAAGRNTRRGSSGTGSGRLGYSAPWAALLPVDNALIESFWSTMQRELLDRHTWATRTDLAVAIFEWIEGWSRTDDTPASAT